MRVMEQGACIWITRPAEDSVSLAGEVAALGYTPVTAPLMTIKNHATPIKLAKDDALAFTSANGVRAFCAGNDVGVTRVFAVGAATAKAARDVGFADVTEAGGDVASLIDCIAERFPHKGGSARSSAEGVVHHIAGSVVAGDLAGGLIQHGYKIERHVLYDAQAVDTLPKAVRETLSAKRLSGVVLYSPRTAVLAVTLLIQAGFEEAAQYVSAFCLSPAVAEKAGALAWSDIRIAEKPTQLALLASLQSAIN